ncbi:MAG TPA: flagellar motor protein [Desulfotomaculum sp.]|nr:MAG: MotA/TolQ/ExbB proton channel [Desulfotomaculum sp. 46_80]HAG11540.1 flagellar motor protein [Desulfotomaculum sp.]HBY03756.1 flagellar motor protein [Desulfotomaculum sp.]
MDPTILIGTLGAIVFLVGGFLLEGGHAGALMQKTAAMIVFGGTIGATIASFSMKEIKTIPGLFKIVLTQKVPEPSEVIEKIVELAEVSRREGLLQLENRLSEIDDPFLRKGLQLLVDGNDPELVKNTLEVEIYATEERHQTGKQIFEAAGGYAPTMGIIGTVMGLVHVLGQLSTPDELGPAIAVAFIATLYGVGSANVIWLPIATKLSGLSKKEILIRQLMMEGVISLQAGYNPTLIRDRLSGFLKPSNRKKEIKTKEE